MLMIIDKKVVEAENKMKVTTANEREVTARQGGKSRSRIHENPHKTRWESRSRSQEKPKFHSISLRSLARRLKQSQVTSASTRIQIKFMRIHGDPQGSTGIHEDLWGSTGIYAEPKICFSPLLHAVIEHESSSKGKHTSYIFSK